MATPPTNKLAPVEEISPDGTPTGQTQAAPVKPVEQPVAEPVKPVEEVVKPELTIVPKEEPADLDINIDAFNAIKDTAEITAVKEQKKAEEAAKLLTTVPPAKETVLKPNQRDYSDLPDEDKPLFERMSNEAFNKLKPAYKDYLKLKAEEPLTKKQIEDLQKKYDESQKGLVKIPESYHSHENAYMLTPEFAQAATQANEAAIIYNHWKNELSNVRKGAKEISFLDRNASGQLAITKKIPADIDSETQLMEWVDYARDLSTKTGGAVQAIRQTYGSKYQDSVQGLQHQETQYFNGLFDTPEKKQTYEPIVKQQLEALPAAFQSSPLAMFVAKSLTMNLVLSKILQQQKGAVAPQVVTPAKPSKQPSAAEIAGDVGNTAHPKKGDDVTVDDFNKVKEGY